MDSNHVPFGIFPTQLFFGLFISVANSPISSEAMFTSSIPECAKPGFDMGLKSGAGLGGVSAAAYSGLMSMCPSLMPHLMAGAAGTAAAAGGAAATGGAMAAGAAAAGGSAAVAMPGLLMAGPMAPLAAMVTAGMVGGAMIGGAAGSMISCREVGVQNDTHFMVQYREVAHPDGFMLDLAKDGRYRPTRGYNHHVHPRPHFSFDYVDDYDYFSSDAPPSAMPHVGQDPEEMMMDYPDYGAGNDFDRFHRIPSMIRPRPRPASMSPFRHQRGFYRQYQAFTDTFPPSPMSRYYFGNRQVGRRYPFHQQRQADHQNSFLLQHLMNNLQQSQQHPTRNPAEPIYYSNLSHQNNSKNQVDHKHKNNNNLPNMESGFTPIDKPHNTTNSKNHNRPAYGDEFDKEILRQLYFRHFLKGGGGGVGGYGPPPMRHHQRPFIPYDYRLEQAQMFPPPPNMLPQPPHRRPPRMMMRLPPPPLNLPPMMPLQPPPYSDNQVFPPPPNPHFGGRTGMPMMLPPMVELPPNGMMMRRQGSNMSPGMLRAIERVPTYIAGSPPGKKYVKIITNKHPKKKRTSKILAVVPKSSRTNRRIEEKNGSNKKKKQVVVMMKKSPTNHIKDDPTKQIKKYEAEAVSHPLAKMFSLKVTGIRRNDHDQVVPDNKSKKQTKGFRASPKDPLFNNRL